MKFPYSMLRDFVETSLDAEAVGDLLTMAGFELEGIEEVEGDAVLDIKVVSNRGDGLSVYGLAREVLAKDDAARATDLYLRAASQFGSEATQTVSREKAVPVVIETEDCTRYACILFEDVNNGASPSLIQKRLRQAGQRPISLLVDLTNYVMLELGQPLHAFDLDKLAGPKIIVRKARAGEKLTTLNGEEHELRSDQMMICDAEKPVAIAGVMGGESSEVSDVTRRVLLESAHFVNTSVRRTRKQLGLSTEASYRFERSVDPEGVVAALARFAELLHEAGAAVRVPGVIDVYPRPVKRDSIELDLDRASTLLGMQIPSSDAVGYLQRLGFTVDQVGTRVTPPSWRPDVVREEDVIEELGRVHGYEKIPEELPSGTTIIGGSLGFEAWCDKVRECCVRAGFTQTISHSLRDKSPLDYPGFEPIGPRNPASPEMAWLRNSLLPCLADNAKRNGGRDVHLFELGRVFGRSSGQYDEFVRLGLLSQGASEQVDWQVKAQQNAGFFSVKGALECLFVEVGVEVRFDGTGVADERLHPTRQARMTIGANLVGTMGEVHPDVAEEIGLAADTVLAELFLQPMYADHHAAPRLKPISRNPCVRRDIALLINKSVAFERIEQALDSAVGDVLERRWLFDVYEGKGIPEGQHSLAIALQLRKQGANFTDEEANQVREKAVAALAALGGTPR